MLHETLETYIPESREFTHSIHPVFTGICPGSQQARLWRVSAGAESGSPPAGLGLLLVASSLVCFRFQKETDGPAGRCRSLCISPNLGA